MEMFSAVLLLVHCSVSVIAELENFSNNEFTDDENRRYIRKEGLSVEDTPNSIDILPGIYPTYTTIPRTGFSCNEKQLWHYYSDPETDCQVFHICETQYSKISFICPVGSIFNQKYLICDWFYNFDCATVGAFYPTNNEFNERGLLDETGKAGDEVRFDLNLASTKQNETPINDTKIRSAFSRSNRLNALPQF